MAAPRGPATLSMDPLHAGGRPLSAVAGALDTRCPTVILERPTWEPGWVWTGDQGLVLGALAGILQITDALKAVDPSFDPNQVRAWIATIVTGTRSLLFDASDNVLREPPFNSSFDDDPKDYVCGRGVLLRYLSEIAVQPYLGDQFSTGIAATAEAVWNGRDTTTDQFGSPRMRRATIR